MDNASNNNTLMTSLESWCQQRGISFSAQDAHMWCMPHTIHLAAIKLLEGIGAILRSKGKKATAQSANYQDNITQPLSRDHDDNATADIDPDMVDADLDPDNTDPAMHVLPAVKRVSFAMLYIHSQLKLKTYYLWKIVRAVRSCPQCRQSWAHEIQFMHLDGSDPSKDTNNCNASHMLILDVRTWWASTHQMLCMLSFWLLTVYGLLTYGM